jgi:hypothetical protein
MHRVLPTLALVLVYGGVVAALWSRLGSTSLFVFGAGFVASLSTYIFLDASFESEDMGQPRDSATIKVDTKHALGDALLLPLPYVATALAVAWLYEHQLFIGTLALLIASILVVARLRSWFKTPT